MSRKAEEAPFHAVMLILGQRTPHWQKACANGLASRNLLAAGSAAICAAKDSAEC